jgi:predicted  nucleic acid-binding Zn-ribbon protein
MSVQICSCEGLNTNCKKCFGSGYMSVSETKTTTTRKSTAKKPDENQDSRDAEDMSTRERKEMQHILNKVIEKLDIKSMQQMRMLHSIPFNTTTFRRDFKDKFESFRIMENEKRELRTELQTITKGLNNSSFSVHLKFNHMLSDKDIDVTSNRELKMLLREYKKLKK